MVLWYNNRICIKFKSTLVLFWVIVRSDIDEGSSTILKPCPRNVSQGWDGNNSYNNNKNKIKIKQSYSVILNSVQQEYIAGMFWEQKCLENSAPTKIWDRSRNILKIKTSYGIKATLIVVKFKLHFKWGEVVYIYQIKGFLLFFPTDLGPTTKWKKSTKKGLKWTRTTTNIVFLGI